VLSALLATRVARPFAGVAGDLAHLSSQAHSDGLTGLANRRLLAARLEDELNRAGAGGTSLSYLMVDIDDFKAFNDTYGHAVGDAVLQSVAAALTCGIRDTDLAARYGGEEFVVLLPGARLDAAARVAEAARSRIEEADVQAPGGRAVHVTASFGVAEFPTYGTATALAAAADAALYQAKRNGKNRVATAAAHGPDGTAQGSTARLSEVV
jgi:diguanylate cyclase (GGDEF)-like protein